MRCAAVLRPAATGSHGGAGAVAPEGRKPIAEMRGAGARAEARATGEHERHLETVRKDPKLRRIVYLHD